MTISIPDNEENIKNCLQEQVPDGCYERKKFGGLAGYG
jgi:hypothetical protein